MNIPTSPAGRSLALLVVSGLLLVAGACSRSKAPEPLGVTELPTALDRAFGDAKDPVRSLVSDVLAAVEKSEWPKASVGIQALSAAADLSPRQRETVARCLITINTKVGEAAAAGDAQAEQVRQAIRQEK